MHWLRNVGLAPKLVGVVIFMLLLAASLVYVGQGSLWSLHTEVVAIRNANNRAFNVGRAAVNLLSFARNVEFLPIQMSAEQRKAFKWRRALSTVDWIATQIPSRARFQILAFNERVEPVTPGAPAGWLDAGDPAQLNGAVEATKKIVPRGGTSLYHALAAIGRMNPKPDNVFLVTDGLPTIDRERGGSGPTVYRSHPTCSSRTTRGHSDVPRVLSPRAWL